MRCCICCWMESAVCVGAESSVSGVGSRTTWWGPLLSISIWLSNCLSLSHLCCICPATFLDWYSSAGWPTGLVSSTLLAFPFLSSVLLWQRKCSIEQCNTWRWKNYSEMKEIRCRGWLPCNWYSRVQVNFLDFWSETPIRPQFESRLNVVFQQRNCNHTHF